MKKLLLYALVALLSCSSIVARLRYNMDKELYYSENAPKNVNQKEYNALVTVIVEYCQENPNINLDAYIMAQLKILGSPASLRLANDLKRLAKETYGDLNKLYKAIRK